MADFVLNPAYMVSQDLSGYFVDKDSGLPLAGGQISFYSNTNPAVPKPVFTLTGSPGSFAYTMLDNPVTLSSVGTPQDAGGNNVVIYYYTLDIATSTNEELYFVVVKDANGVEQFSRYYWPNPEGSSSANGASGLTDNQISNSQFSLNLLNPYPQSTTTFTVSGSTGTAFPIAPDWNIYLVGTGSVTVNIIPQLGSSNLLGAAPYLLDVTTNPSGTFSAYLQQRFQNNAGLWSSNNDKSVYLATTISVESITVGTFD